MEADWSNYFLRVKKGGRQGRIKLVRGLWQTGGRALGNKSTSKKKKKKKRNTPEGIGSTGPLNARG